MTSKQTKLMMAAAAALLAACSADATGLERNVRATGAATETIKDEGVATPIDKCTVFRNELCTIE